MKSIVLAVIVAVALVALHGATVEAAINCYACTATSSTSSSTDPCWPPLKAPTTSSSNSSGNSTTNSTATATSSVSIQPNCNTCVTLKTVQGGTTTYLRQCSTAASSTFKNGCVSKAGVLTCTSFCTTELCNTGSYASFLRYSVLSIISALILSATSKFMH